VNLGSSTVAFDHVTVAGTTGLVRGTLGPDLPSGFLPVPVSAPTYYEFDTSAIFAGSVTVCLQYDPGTVQGNEAGLRLWHFDPSQGWQDVTSSLDVAQSRICGRVSSLSPFAIVERDPTNSDPIAGLPTRTRLLSGLPNPFHRSTTIQYELAQTERVQVTIYDISGKRIRDLHSMSSQSRGRYAVRWDGRNTHGVRVAAGVYFCELRTSAGAETTRLVLLR